MTFLATKLLHHVGVMALFLSLGGLAALRLAPGSVSTGLARLLRIVHGVSLLLILVAGFGLLAKLGLAGSWPLWVTVKILVWLALGAAPVFLRGSEAVARVALAVVVVVGAVAAWAALTKF